MTTPPGIEVPFTFYVTDLDKFTAWVHTVAGSDPAETGISGAVLAMPDTADGPSLPSRQFAARQLREAAKTYRELADESLSAEADAIVRGLDARANALFPIPSQPAGSGSHSGHASP